MAVKKIVMKSKNNQKKTENKLKTDYLSVKLEFEKFHAKIINKSFFIKYDNDNHIILSKNKLITSYEHLSYTINVKDEVKQKNFINTWIKDSNIKQFADVGIFPNSKLCPASIFNLWQDFEMKKVKKFEYKKEELNLILNHIKILCNHQDDVFQYFLKFLGQMLKHPHVKPGVCVTFISQEGSGKGLLLQILRKVMGQSKIYETTKPSQFVFGNFNGSMANSFLVNLNEMSKRESVDAEGQIKGLITDSALTINNKNVDSYQIESFHRFIIFSNQDDPINSKKDDRRNIIIRSSDEKIGNKNYFTKLFEILEDKNALKTFYEYLINQSDLENFRKLKKPVTDYQQEIQENSNCVIEKFIIDTIYENRKLKELKITNKTLFENFLAFIADKKIKYEINKFQFDLKLSRLCKKSNIVSKKASNDTIKIFDIVHLLKYYQIQTDFIDIAETKSIIDYNC